MLLVTAMTTAPSIRATRKHGGQVGAFSSPVQEVHIPAPVMSGYFVLVPGFRGTTNLRQDMLDFIRTH
jgi:hypothetical protein